MTSYKAPFPWFGGKSRVAPIVWQAFGDVKNYVEPFFGSGAVLLGRPHTPHTETINDKDGFVANAWRAIQREPEAVAYYADQPVFENDLHARHHWLVQKRDLLAARLEGDLDYYDPIIAGYWLWGISCWIGGEFASGKGPWHRVDGQLLKCDQDASVPSHRDQGIRRTRVHLGSHGGQGIHARTAGFSGVVRKRVHLSNSGRGVSYKDGGQAGLTAWMQGLAERLRQVRVCCGDWTRVMGKAVTQQQRINAVFLDPPYARNERSKDIYTVEADISDAVRQWALDNGDNPKLRIILCGYDGEHAMPKTWYEIPWTPNGGYANSGKPGRSQANKNRERLWLSPHCLEVEMP